MREKYSYFVGEWHFIWRKLGPMLLRIREIGEEMRERENKREIERENVFEKGGII